MSRTSRKLEKYFEKFQSFIRLKIFFSSKPFLVKQLVYHQEQIVDVFPLLLKILHFEIAPRQIFQYH